MSYDALKKRLDAGHVVILDGGTGTELQRRGVPMDGAAWCGPATLGNDKLLTEIHGDYIKAGAEVITANTYASSRLMLEQAGQADKLEEINCRAVEAALRAQVLKPDGQIVVVAGSLSHMVPTTSGSPGVSQSKMPSVTEMSDAFHELAQLLKTAGVELILLEMMYHPERVKLAVEAALATALPVWFGLSARRAKNGRVVSYLRSEDLPLDEIARLIPRAGIDAAGPMHTNSEVIASALSITRKYFSGALTAYPDSGFFEMPNWQFDDGVPPERFEVSCQNWIKAGVQVVGGCCGLTAEHIKAAVRARAAVRPRFNPLERIRE
jgi:methionine synthase I (cobalamin-dependent)